MGGSGCPVPGVGEAQAPSELRALPFIDSANWGTWLTCLPLQACSCHCPSLLCSWAGPLRWTRQELQVGGAGHWSRAPGSIPDHLSGAIPPGSPGLVCRFRCGSSVHPRLHCCTHKDLFGLQRIQGCTSRLLHVDFNQFSGSHVGLMLRHLGGGLLTPSVLAGSCPEGPRLTF